MPTTYAHDRFGREVYEQLPVNLKKIIRENKKLYLIGLHGPDIFFYYHPFSKNRVSDYGTFLHEQTASVLFEDEVKKYQQSPSEAMEAYLLGFAPGHSGPRHRCLSGRGGRMEPHCPAADVSLCPGHCLCHLARGV